MRIIDHSNPPSKPRELNGKAAIAAFHDDVCGRAMTHRVEAGVADGDELALPPQSYAYPDGLKVYCSTMVELEGGKIGGKSSSGSDNERMRRKQSIAQTASSPD